MSKLTPEQRQEQLTNSMTDRGFIFLEETDLPTWQFRSNGYSLEDMARHFSANQLDKQLWAIGPEHHNHPSNKRPNRFALYARVAE